MKRKNTTHHSGNEDLKRQNNTLDNQSESNWFSSECRNANLTKMYKINFSVRQLERQLSAAGEADMVGIRNDQNSSESEMSDIDDEESQVDIVSTPSQPNAKKIKTSYNAKVLYQWRAMCDFIANRARCHHHCKSHLVFRYFSHRVTFRL